jgi:hypothetical protein
MADSLQADMAPDATRSALLADAHEASVAANLTGVLTWDKFMEEMSSLASAITTQLSKSALKIDVVVAIVRGGMIPAVRLTLPDLTCPRMHQPVCTHPWPLTVRRLIVAGCGSGSSPVHTHLASSSAW